MENNNIYYIVFSGSDETKYDGTIIAKKFCGIPDETKLAYCKVFGFRILSEEEFNNINVNKKVIL